MIRRIIRVTTTQPYDFRGAQSLFFILSKGKLVWEGFQRHYVEVVVLSLGENLGAFGVHFHMTLDWCAVAPEVAENSVE